MLETGAKTPGREDRSAVIAKLAAKRGTVRPNASLIQPRRRYYQHLSSRGVETKQVPQYRELNSKS